MILIYAKYLSYPLPSLLISTLALMCPLSDFLHLFIIFLPHLQELWLSSHSLTNNCRPKKVSILRNLSVDHEPALRSHASNSSSALQGPPTHMCPSRPSAPLFLSYQFSISIALQTLFIYFLVPILCFCLCLEFQSP